MTVPQALTHEIATRQRGRLSAAECVVVSTGPSVQCFQSKDQNFVAEPNQSLH